MNTTFAANPVQFGMKRSTQRATAGVAASGAALVALMGGTASAVDNSTHGDQFVASATASPTSSDASTPQDVRQGAEHLLETLTKIQKDCHLRKDDPEIDSNDDSIKFRCHDAIQEGQALQKMMSKLPEYANQAKTLKETLEQAQKKLDEARETDNEQIVKGLLLVLIPLVVGSFLGYGSGVKEGRRREREGG